MSVRLSVVIPTYNEEANIYSCVQHLLKMPGVSEVIVSDGDSSDLTTKRAIAAGATVISGPRQRLRN